MNKRSTRAAAAVGFVAFLFSLQLTLNVFDSGFWYVAAAACVVAAVLMTRPDPRLDRVRAGRCRHCNYDLRGTRGRCPECGKLVPPGTPISRD